MKNYVYVATLIDGKGWDEGPGGADECLWANSEEGRIFGTAKEAWAFVAQVRNAGCWSYEDDDGNARTEIPEITVTRHAVYEWLWGDHDEVVTDRVVDLHGGPIRLADMPVKVGRFLIGVFCGAARNWMRESNNLRGASSATHTAAFISARFANRVSEIKESFATRGIEI